jgi:hypothetical protein
MAAPPFAHAEPERDRITAAATVTPLSQTERTVPANR